MCIIIQGTTLDVFTWNDMNEPSVFNGPEVTMPKDKRHLGDLEHRELHNMYGFLYTIATHQVLRLHLVKFRTNLKLSKGLNPPRSRLKLPKNVDFNQFTSYQNLNLKKPY